MDFRRTARVLAQTAVAVAIASAGTLATGSPAQAASTDCQAIITGITVDGTALKPTAAQPFSDPARAFQYAVDGGESVTVFFNVVGAGCTRSAFTLASYRADLDLVENPAAFHASQTLFDSATKRLRPGTGYSLTIDVPVGQSRSGVGPGCTNKFLTERYEQSLNGNGGDEGNNYASTCDGRPSGNGNGDGNANGKPCAGCVGNADNKNPPGQAPDGSDNNNGYECDGNNGIAKENPAHTGCASQNGFQIDFHRGVAAKTVPAAGLNPNYAYQVGD